MITDRLSCRGYTKAPEGRGELQRVHKAPDGRQEKKTFSGHLDDQDDLGPRGFCRLLFLYMFKNSSPPLLVPDSRRTEAIALDLPR